MPIVVLFPRQFGPDFPLLVLIDFGNVTYELPGIHALYQIPLGDPHKNGNHTKGFADAAKTPEAHEATLKAATGIAVIGAKVLVDKEFRDETWKAWKEARKDK